MSRHYTPRRASGWSEERRAAFRAAMAAHYADPANLERSRAAGARRSTPPGVGFVPSLPPEKQEIYRFLTRKKHLKRSEALVTLGMARRG